MKAIQIILAVVIAILVVADIVDLTWVFILTAWLCIVALIEDIWN